MAKPKRVYEVWAGRNKFMCNGRLVFGPSVRPLVVTLLLILVPIVIFCTTVARNLIHEMSARNAGYATLVLAILLTVYVLVLLFLTSAQDPGIVPRNLLPTKDMMPFKKEIFVNGKAVTVKYCMTCRLYCPPRCLHCSECDNCVEQFDHHNIWIGQCIGKRNYRYFFLFVSSSALLCSFIVAMSALDIKFQRDKHGTVWKAIKESLASIILVAYSSLFYIFLGCVSFMLIYLTCKNMTTYEAIRMRESAQLHAYNKGWLNNLHEVFCPKLEPGIDFRAFVQENEQRPSLRLIPEAEAHYLGGDRRAKVEDDIEIGGDLLKISQCRNVEEAEAHYLGGDRRAKVEDDIEIAGDLLKISQCRNVEEA